MTDLTARELQSLRNLGCEFERAANELEAHGELLRLCRAERDELAATHYAQKAEIERLTGVVKAVNSQAEHFEREWYLRGDEIERLRAAAEQARAAMSELVACKTLKDALVSTRSDPYYVTQADRIELEYERRKPLAWPAARDALRALDAALEVK